MINGKHPARKDVLDMLSEALVESVNWENKIQSSYLTIQKIIQQTNAGKKN